MIEWPDRQSTLSCAEKVARRSAFVLERVPPLVKMGMNRHQIADTLKMDYCLLVKYMKKLNVKCPRACAGGGKGQMGVRPFAGFSGNARKMKERIECLKKAGFHY